MQGHQQDEGVLGSPPASEAGKLVGSNPTVLIQGVAQLGESTRSGSGRSHVRIVPP